MSDQIQEFVKKSEKYIESNSDKMSFKAVESAIRKFLRFYEAHGKALSEYTSADYKKFFADSYKTSTSFTSVKSWLVNYLRALGELKPADILYRAKIVRKMNYLTDFSELKDGIEKVRKEKNAILIDEFSKKNPGMKIGCDQLTMGEIALYLLWIGVPRNELIRLPLSAIDLDKNAVIGSKEYSFANEEHIIAAFKEYKLSETFVMLRAMGDGKVCFQNSCYYGNGIIRSRNQNTADSEKAKDTLLYRLFSTFPFAVNALNVFRSGQFSRGYEKYEKGEFPDFDSATSLWEYFRVEFGSVSESELFRRDWNEYLDWRSEK